MKFVLLYSLIIFSSLLSKAETIVVDSKLDVINQFNKSNVTYYINEILDLKEDTLCIPHNSILLYSKKGMICNGVVKGSNTVIKASKYLILKDVTLEGTWKTNMYIVNGLI